ncbi:hypothetical protein FPOAC1_005248 [Fusarium poae]|uniref:hypothetical protein n=1 Tax=Fusarium poae TaxID=36050 RepID=UPI001CE8DAD3|nr:hypothetical protein FPOAC1_005248 [Fusarium poae]KAG8671989.1 hypothetical protein FPOAC1_005248 [Fusarium poae]
MIAKSFTLALFAATAAAGPCRPGHTTTSDPTTTDSAIISSSTTEEAAVTTTSVIEPAGEAIILKINLNTRLVKRDTIFVGNDNPSDCTFASVFRLDSDQLLYNGVPVYFAGNDYQELVADGQPPADAVTTTFSVSGGKLAWENDAFGVAGFCYLESDGKIYITFGSSPDGCEVVSLTAYKETQCQNGQIVGLETSTTDVGEPTTTAEATTTADICVAGVGGPNGQPPRASRLADCSRLNVVTVSPFPVTTTVVKREVAVRIPTGKYTGQPVINTLNRRAEGEPTATTIQPTNIPAYATYCDSPEAYYDACSEAGITAFTTTLPTGTSTTETTVTDCPGRKMAKRAGQAMGYEFEDNWEAYNMPGYKLF